MDSNAVERTIRPIALNRKNALFAGHDAGAQNWAIIASLIETCKLNGIEPQGYLSAILTAIAGAHKQSDIKEALLQNSPSGRASPLSPLNSGHAFDLGLSERVEAVHEGDTDVDFSGLAVGVT
jgi:hypothetical protein